MPSGRPALYCPALRAGQGKKYLMFYRPGQGRAGHKKSAL